MSEFLGEQSSLEVQTEVRELVKLRLGKGKIFSVLVGLLPDQDWEDIDLEKWPEVYIQSGGIGSQIVIEVRIAQGSSFRQFYVGRPSRGGTPLSDKPFVTVEWPKHSYKVHDDEVFTPDQAAEVFQRYLDGADLEILYSLRPIEL